MDASCPITWIEPDLTVNADPAAQLRLLDLQAADTALAQLVHRRSTLPELAALADATQRTEVLATEAAELETRLADVDAAQRRLEAEVDNVRARTARDERRLTGEAYRRRSSRAYNTRSRHWPDVRALSRMTCWT